MDLGDVVVTVQELNKLKQLFLECVLSLQTIQASENDLYLSYDEVVSACDAHEQYAEKFTAIKALGRDNPELKLVVAKTLDLLEKRARLPAAQDSCALDEAEHAADLCRWFAELSLNTGIDDFVKLLCAGARRTQTDETELKAPTDVMIAAYRLKFLLGNKTQQDIADMLSAEFKRKIPQGTISRWLGVVEKWVKAGNVLPEIQCLTREPQSIDPAVIDMGARPDHRTRRQRAKKDDDDD